MSGTYRNIARVVRTHGRHGEVAVQPVRGLPLVIREGMRVALTPPAFDRDRFCHVESVNAGPDDCLVAFSGITDLTLAESIVGCRVLADTADFELDPLVRPVDELLGREVVDRSRGHIGSIEEVMETPANDVWVVSGAAFGEVLIPVIEQVVPVIPDTGDILVDLLDGLIDDEADGGASC